MERKFWKPSITTQFDVCPIPFHMDTYRGCKYDCKYCFARDFVVFSRRNSEYKDFSYLIGNRPDLLEKWIQRTLTKEYDYNKSEEVAFKERIPIKIGATADPCPPIEKIEKVTLECLKVFSKYDYPIELQTKNPEVLVSYIDELDIGMNLVIAVTLISMDEEFIKICEPNTISAKRRINAIKILTDKGFKVMVKIQPAIYPKVIDDLPDLVKAIKYSGCFGFNIEGLKVRIAMPKNEQLLFEEIGNFLGYNIRDFYRCEQKTGSDWELSYAKKLKYINLANQLAKENDLKFYVADNDMGQIGCNGECCGTEVLRDYKIWDNNFRSKSFPSRNNGSTELGKCNINFCRSKKYDGKTLNEAIQEDKRLRSLF